MSLRACAWVPPLGPPTCRLVAYGKNFIKFYDLIRPEVQQQQAKGGAGAAGWDCAQNAGV